MRAALSLLIVLVPLFVYGGERCLAIDGDTLVCNYEKVRLTNVYAAELNEPGGWAAKRRLQAMISAGEVTMHRYGKDRYGRTLAEVYVNGRRIEQSDIGPRAGRGSQWHGDRHQRIRIRKARFARSDSHMLVPLKNMPTFLRFFAFSSVSGDAKVAVPQHGSVK